MIITFSSLLQFVFKMFHHLIGFKLITANEIAFINTFHRSNALQHDYMVNTHCLCILKKNPEEES